MKGVGNYSVTAEEAHKQKGTVTELNRSKKRIFYLRWLMFTFFKVIGMATFSSPCSVSRNKCISNSPCYYYSMFGTSYNVVLTIITVGINYFSLPIRRREDNTGKISLSEVIEIAQGILGTLVMSVMYLTHGFNQTTFIRIVNRLLDVERDVQPLENSKGCRKVVTGIAIYFVFNFLTVGAQILDFVAYHNSLFASFTDIVPTFLVGWLMLQYYFVLDFIESKFVNVNHSIQILPRTGNPGWHEYAFGRTQRVFVGNFMMNDLIRLENIHVQLHEILNDIADFYSLPMLGVIGFMFLTLIYNGYWAVALLLEFEQKQLWSLISTIWWLVFLMFPLLLLTTKVYKISMEVSIFKVMRHSTKKEVLPLFIR